MDPNLLPLLTSEQRHLWIESEPGFPTEPALVSAHINIAHGLYPHESMTQAALTSLVRFLQVNISQTSGRTYAGGLTKFEPREMERLIVPGPALLNAEAVK